MKRLQFELSDRRVEELDTLVERTGLKTRVQLINTALTLFEWAIREREAGRIIASIDEKRERYKEIEMPGFPGLEEPKEALEVILGQLEHYLETSEQEDAFAVLANVLNKEILGKNSDHPDRPDSEGTPRAGEDRTKTIQDKSPAVEESASREPRPVKGPPLVFDSPDPADMD